jgi:hypothetical protein
MGLREQWQASAFAFGSLNNHKLKIQMIVVNHLLISNAHITQE